MTRSRLLGFLGASVLCQLGCSSEVSGPAGNAGSTTGAVGPAGAGGSGPAGNGQGAGSGNGGSPALGGSAGNESNGGAGGASVGGSSGSGGTSADSGAGGGGAGGDSMSAGAAGAAGSSGSAGDTAMTGGGIGGAEQGGAGQGGTGQGGAGQGGAGGQGGTSVEPVPLDPSLLSKCSGTKPIRCTIPVPANGNYNVTVELGSATASSTSRVLAELARLQTQAITLAAGELSKQTFSVNVRTEVHDDYRAPGMTLNLEIDGSAPALHGVGFAAAPTIPTLFIAGDSTSCDWDPAYVVSQPLERGWAQELSQYLVPGLAVANYADSGDTAGSLYGKFASRGATMKQGDYLFIQFGHNDQKDQAAVNAFKTNLMKFVNDARTAGATPIVFTPVARKSATTGNPGFNGLDGQVRELAASANVAMVDLTALAIAYYDTLTSAQLNATFFSPSEGTHFSESGATAIAGIVAKDLKSSTVSIRDFVR